MKPILILLLTAISAMAATVEVISPTEVRVDGANFGAVADTIANNPKIASDVQRALEAWDVKTKAATQSDKDTAVAAVQKQLDETTAAKTLTQAECNKLQADYNALLAKVKAAASITAVKSIVTAAELPAVTKERLALEAQIAELQTKAAALK